MSDLDQPAATVRYVVTGGGSVSDEALAAITVALAPVAVETPAGAQGSSMSHWARAALEEGIGHRPYVAWSDFEGGRFPLA